MAASAAKKPLPKEVVEKTKHHLIDTIAAMVSGSKLIPGRKAIAYVKLLGGTKEAVVAAANDGLIERTPERFAEFWFDFRVSEVDLELFGGLSLLVGEVGGDGTFDYWEVSAAPAPDIERHCAAWCRKKLAGYTGMINLETIGGRIIEVHLRFADQWPDLYGEGWVDSLIRLYAHGEWRFDEARRRAGYSVVLFLPHGRRYRHPPRALQEAILRTDGISSLQITFHEERDPARHAMPPGGFRVAIVNCWDRAAGNRAREHLRSHFESTSTA